ncbi:hypothetical protein, partial [Brucella intermedia]|uniref:hypothetical protein n=1 Tax=Brucella intermedia TaxID=94625 RepID=UPI0023607936
TIKLLQLINQWVVDGAYNIPIQFVIMLSDTIKLAPTRYVTLFRESRLLGNYRLRTIRRSTFAAEQKWNENL